MARSRWLAALVAAAGVAGAVAYLASRPRDGPAPVAWDRVACAHCRMLVSDPRFAAQLALADGEVLHFDDPGCLLLARESLARPVRAAWFHDSASDAWLAEAEVAFLRGAETPMGHGLAAVRRGSAPGAIDAAQARAALAGPP